jgi:hypothetical protein
MAQVLSVSATTAAYASEATKPIQRVSKRSEVEQAIHELAKKAEMGDDFQLKALMTVVRPPSLALYFLTASQHQNPQVTLEQAQEAYEENEGASSAVTASASRLLLEP